MKILYFILILFVLLDIKSLYVQSIVTPTQANLLSNIAIACGINWYGGPPACGSYDQATPSKINCDSSGNVNSLILESPTSCNLNSTYDKFDIFTSLTVLSITKINMTVAFNSIQTHQKITNLYYFGNNENQIYFPFSTVFDMPNLDIILIYFPSGVLPTTISNRTTQYHIYGSSPSKFTAHFPVEQMNSYKTYFYFIVFGMPTNFTDVPSNVFSLLPNVQTFHFAIVGYTINFQNFVNPPASLTTLGFYSMNLPLNTLIPDINLMGWQNIKAFTLMNLNLQGQVPKEYFAPHITSLIFNLNQALIVRLDLIGNSSISSLDISYTGSIGSVPENILDGGLVSFNAQHTSLSGNLPDAILCLPNIALQSYYKFDSDAFNNYFGPTSPRTCKPNITSIEPQNISTSDFYFTIKGTSLGSTSTYFRISMNTQSESIVLTGTCVTKKVSKEIQCINPNIQGAGTLNFQALNDQTPASIASIDFEYEKPIVTYISPVPTLGGDLTIYGNNLIGIHMINTSIYLSDNSFTCNYWNMKLIAPNSVVVCPNWPAGINSNIPLIVYIKRIINNYMAEPKFFYKPPSVKTSVYIKPNTDISLTIYGQDFWNDTSLVGVKIDDFDCNVTFINHSVLHCNFGKIPFSPGSKSIYVTVADQSSMPNALFSMVDPSYCPSYCSNGGNCDPNIGFCMCTNGFAGPSCEQKTIETDGTFDSDLPILEIDNSNPDTSLFAQLMSVNQNGQTIDLSDSSDWSVNDDSDTQTTYSYNKGTIKLGVSIRKNINAGSESFGGSTITFPNESYTYIVKYESTKPVNNLYFGFRIGMDPLECEPPPYAFSYPTGTNYGSAHYLTLLKYNTQWHARFPLVTVLNSGKSYATISTETVNLFGNYTDLNAHIQSEKISSATFQYDFTLLKSSSNRIPVTNGCEVEVKKSNNGWKIGVGIGVPIGVGLLAAAGFFIFKQQRKIDSTKRLLDQKLSELSRYRD